MRAITKILVLIFIIIFVTEAVAQDEKPSPIQFHGSNTLFGQYSNRQGVNSEVPPSLYRDDLQMTLSVYDIPVGASFFITSEERDFRQSINHFRIYFDYKSFLKNQGLDAFELKNTLDKLQSAQTELEINTNSLNIEYSEAQNLVNSVKSEYDQVQARWLDAKKSGDAAAITKAEEDLKTAETALKDAQNKAAELKAKYEKAKATMEKAQEKIDIVKKYAETPGLMQGDMEQVARSLVSSKFGKVMSAFSVLEIGKCRPNYSELTLKGISVSGVNVELTPGLFYAAFSYGEAKRSIEPSPNARPTYKRNMIFGKIGVGKKNQSHFYLTYMESKDDAASLPYSPELDSLYIRPQANNVIGIEGMLSFAKRRITLEGEVAGSLHTRDTQSPELDSYIDGQIPDWVVNTLDPNMSSSVDYAYNVKATVNIKDTKVTGEVRRVGPGFRSFGNPNVLTDRMTYGGTFDQAFAKKQVSLSVFYRQSRDNLIDWKTATTRTIAYGITAMFRFKKAPYFQVSYMPNLQKTKNAVINMQNDVRIITASTGYNYKIGAVRSNTTVNFSYQDVKTTLDTINTRCTTQNYMFQEDLTFKIPLTLSAGIGYNRSVYTEIEREIMIYTLSANHSAFDRKWNNRLGLKWSNQIYEQNKLGLFWNSKVKLWKNGDLDLRIEENLFNDNVLAGNSFDEFIGQLTFAVRW